jgi:hypothetical protein
MKKKAKSKRGRKERKNCIFIIRIKENTTETTKSARGKERKREGETERQR